ncbi:hypothetical protein IWZ01DRAFT_295245 [Phyllosticta capitalensis]
MILRLLWASTPTTLDITFPLVLLLRACTNLCEIWPSAKAWVLFFVAIDIHTNVLARRNRFWEAGVVWADAGFLKGGQTFPV